LCFKVINFKFAYSPPSKRLSVFNKSSGPVEVTGDVVFDESNGSLREQVGLNDVDENEVLTTAMIGDV
jgi:hypothetical protein